MSEFNKSLYELTDDLILQFNEIAEHDGELSEESESKINEISLLIKSKVDSCVGYDQYLSDKIVAVSVKIKELQDLKKSIENKKESLLRVYEKSLLRLGEKEFRGNLSVMKIKKKSMVVNILDEDKIPFEFIQTKTISTISKDLIKKAFKDGQKVEGAEFVETSKPSLILKSGV